MIYSTNDLETAMAEKIEGVGRMDPERIRMYKKTTHRLLIALISIVAVLSAGLWIPLASGDRAYLFPIVMSAGVLGGFVSLQRRLKSLTDDDLQLLSDSWLYVWLSPFVGGLLAAVLYLLFLSHLLSGELFPNFVFDESMAETVHGLSRLFHMQSDTPEQYAKLLFWSFLAGFSEKFVVDIIGTFDNAAKRDP